MNEVLQRLRERKLVQWALAYGAAAFALIQVLDIVAQRFGWPEQAERFVIIALAVGFFVTLVLAWYHGEHGAQRMSGTELMILALLLAIGGGFLWRFGATASAPERSPAAGAPASATASFASAHAEDKSIAVLPFENLSDEKANAYFAEGMQDEILTRLAKIGALKVVSRTSTMQFASKPGNLPEIARQLGVTNILEGSVQKAANRVRINVQLIRAEGDNHLWAETYDRTLDDIFGVQGEVAGAIADKLGAQLNGGARQEVTAIPTRNAAAYDAYLRGLSLFNRGFQSAAFIASTRAFEEAVKADPEFAQAWALLARGNAMMIFFGLDASPARRAAALHALQTAERLAPDSLEAQAARGYYVYRVERNYDDARRRFEALHERWPNDSEILIVLSYVLGRQGHGSEAAARIEEALRLDPLNIRLHKLRVVDALWQRRFDDALRAIERAQALGLADVELARMQGAVYIGQGDLANAARVLDKPPTDSSDDLSCYIALAMFQRSYAPAIGWMKPRVARPDKDEAATDRLNDWVGLADLQRLAGDRAAAVENYRGVRDAARTLLGQQPDNVNVLLAIAQAEAGLDNPAASFAALDRLAEVTPESRDVYLGRLVLESRARILARFGRKQEAIAGLRYLLTVSYGASSMGPITPAILKLDPDFDALRDDPEFKALLDSPVTAEKGPARG